MFVSINLSSQIRIYPKLNQSDTIDFGIRYYQNDEVVRYVTIENNSEDTLFIGEVAPTFATVFASGYGDTHFSFVKRSNSSQRFNPNTKTDVALRFFDHPDLPSNQRIGEMGSFLLIGLAKDLNNPNSLVYKDTFFLYGVSSNLFFDIYKDTVSFGNVFIDSDNLLTREIILRNNSPNPFIDVTKADFEVVTSITKGEEFFVDGLELPLKLASRTNPGQDPELARVRYKPKDKGADTALYTFRGEITGSQKDTIIDRTCLISGFGIDFSYGLVSSNFPISNSPISINLGDVKTNEVIDINAIIQNLSNIDFELVNATFSDDFISSTFSDFDNNLSIDETLNLSFKFKTNSKGLFTTQLLIETDLKDKGIGGFQENKHKYIKVNVLGRGIEPRLNIGVDTLDLGIISSYGSCESIREIEIPLRNSGNYDLEILDFGTNDNINYLINIEENKFIIPENEFARLKLIFSPSDVNAYGEYYVDVYLVTNQSKPNDTVRFTAKINLVRAGDVDLRIPNINFKPGNKIKVPILIAQGNIDISNQFNFTLSYDPSLIRLNSFTTTNTASENTDNLIQINGKEGRKDINIIKPTPMFFNDSDTLINFIFDTYVGYDRESSIIIENPKFADANCDDLFPITISSGRVRADSLANIDEIFYDFSGIIVIPQSQIPANDFVVYKIKSNLENTLVSIKLINLNSKVLQEKSIVLNKNESEIFFNLSEITSGSYYIHISYLDKIKVLPLNVIK